MWKQATTYVEIKRLIDKKRMEMGITVTPKNYDKKASAVISKAMRNAYNPLEYCNETVKYFDENEKAKSLLYDKAFAMYLSPSNRKNSESVAKECGVNHVNFVAMLTRANVDITRKKFN